MTNKLTKHQVVLDFDEHFAGYAIYAVPYYVQSKPIITQTKTYIPYRTWLALGGPDQVTVTIVPGDTLNG